MYQVATASGSDVTKLERELKEVFKVFLALETASYKSSPSVLGYQQIKSLCFGISANQVPLFGIPTITTQAPEVKMSMFWNPVTGTYQRSCPALSPVQKQPLKSGVKPLKVGVRVQPQIVIQRQPQNVANKPWQPDQSQPPNCQPLDRHKCRPPLADKSQPLHARKQPKNFAKCSSQLPNQPERKQYPTASQPQIVAKNQPPNVGDDRRQSVEQSPQPPNVQPPDALDPIPNKQPQSAAKSQVKQPPNVAQPPNTVQPQMPDLPPDPDPSKCKKVRMPIATGNTSYPQWGKATPSYLKIHQLKKK